MKSLKSKYKPGQTFFCKNPRLEHPVHITLLEYLPRNEWYARYNDPTTNEIKKDYFDERDFD